MYLAEKFGAFLPTRAGRSGPRTPVLAVLADGLGTRYLGGGFGHFYAYAPMKSWNIRSTATPWR